MYTKGPSPGSSPGSSPSLSPSSPSPRFTVLGGAAVFPESRHLIAAILNVTPDSFSDGGRYAGVQAAVEAGLALAAAGAHVIDVGGESTRPGASPVDAAEEAARVVPVIRGLAGQVPVSVDTYKAATAEAAIAAGAVIVNDISAARFDPRMVEVLAEHKPGYILMHSLGRPRQMQKNPVYGDVVAEILAFFEERLGALAAAGLPEERIVLDPGIGFGKTLTHNLEILRRIREFNVLGRPLCLGVSRKSWLGELLGLPVSGRDAATAAATALFAAQGVFMHRVHDPAGAAAAVTLAREIAGDKWTI